VSLIEANGIPVQLMTLGLVSGRAWECELYLETDTAPSEGSRIEIKGPGGTFIGTAQRPGADSGGQVTTKVVGGAGKLGTELPPRNYTGTTVGEVARHIVDEVGETLSPTVAAAVKSTPLARWPRTRGDAATCLTELAADIGAAWRVLADGTVWLGVDDGAEVTIEHDVLDEKPATGEVTVGVESFGILPGQTFRGGPVAGVDYTLGKGFTARVVRRSGSGLSRAADAAAAKATAGTKLHPPTAARVVSQNADGTLELAVDSKSVGSISKVEIRHGFPGVTKLEMKPGARVALFFEGGDKKRCFAALFAGSSTTKVILDGEHFEFGGDGPVAMALPLEMRIAAIETYLKTPGPVIGPAPLPAIPFASTTLFAKGP
jgi:hypothetical protein